MKYLTNIDLTKQQLMNAAIHNLAGTTPSNPVEGQLYYDTVEHYIYVWNGSEWRNLDASGAVPAAADLVSAINSSNERIDLDNLASGVTTAVNDSHTHSNKAILDATEVAYTAVASAKLDSIDASANLYVHPTGDGNLHVPATSINSSGKVLTAGATAGSLSWETPQTGVSDWSEITNKPTSPASGIDAAVSASHAQNTDTGTSSATFTIGTGGPKVKNNAGELQARNNADDDYADLRVKNLVVEGTTTTINAETIELADNQIVLNSNITTNAGNANGGISVKRLMVDNNTRKDAELYYDDSTGRWYTKTGPVANDLITAPVPSKIVTTVGNGSALTYDITHNLNTWDVITAVRETGTTGSEQVVMADIQMLTANSIRVSFAVAPTTDKYTVIIIG